MTSPLPLSPSGAAPPVLNDSADRPGLRSELATLVRYRPLLRHLVVRDVKVRYKRSVLGFFWTMLNPLLTMLILNFVFSQAFRVEVPHYGVYVLSGVLFWNFFAQSSTQAMNALMQHQGLVRIVYMPRSVYAFAVVGSGLVHLALALVPLLAVMLAAGLRPRPVFLFLPVAVLLVALFTLGLSLALSALAAFFHDVVQMFQILLVAWFYLTPVMFPKEIVPDRFRILLDLNPLTPLLDLFRDPVWAGTLPPASTIAAATVLALLSFAVGWWAFVRNTDRIVMNL